MRLAAATTDAAPTLLDFAGNVLAGLLGVTGGLVVYALGQRATVRQARVQARLSAAAALLDAAARYEDELVASGLRPGAGVPLTTHWHGYTTSYRIRKRQLDWPDADWQWDRVMTTGRAVREAASRGEEKVAELRVKHHAQVRSHRAVLEEVLELGGVRPRGPRPWRRKQAPPLADAETLAARIYAAIEVEENIARRDCVERLQSGTEQEEAQA